MGDVDFQYIGIYGTKPSSAMPTRMQNHEVQTSDGIDWGLVNLGNAGELTLIYCNGGSDWNEVFSLPDTNTNSTADMQVVGHTLDITYLDAQDQVCFASYRYQPNFEGWLPSTSGVIEIAPLSPEVHPTITVNYSGDIFAAYTNPTLSGLEMVLDESTNNGQSWTPVFETTFGGVSEGSAKVLELHGHTDLIYSTVPLHRL